MAKYTIYGEDYDFDDLLMRADAGLSNYLTNVLKLKDKYHQEYYDAYRNFMKGIGEGKIKWENGRYTVGDGLGYTNVDGKRDPYGDIAYYIYKKSINGKKYVDPSKQSDDSSTKTEDTGTAVKDSSVSNESSGTSVVEQPSVVAEVTDPNADFYKYLNEKYKPYTGTLRDMDLRLQYAYDNDTVMKVARHIKNMSEQDLNNILRDLISTPNYKFSTDPRIKSIFNGEDSKIENNLGFDILLNYFLNKNKLKQISAGVYYVPNSVTKNNTCFIWDYKNHKLKEVSIHEIPFIRQKIRARYDKEHSASANEYNQYSQYPEYNLKS